MYIRLKPEPFRKMFVALEELASEIERPKVPKNPKKPPKPYHPKQANEIYVRYREHGKHDFQVMCRVGSNKVYPLPIEWLPLLCKALDQNEDATMIWMRKTEEDIEVRLV